VEEKDKSLEVMAIEKIAQLSDSVFEKFASEYPGHRRTHGAHMHASWRACVKWLSSSLVQVGGEAFAKEILSAPIDRLDRLP
jgi:hypothetical protein